MDPDEIMRELRDMILADLPDPEANEDWQADWAKDVANERCRQYARLVAALDTYLAANDPLPLPMAWARAAQLT